ncbi:FecR family protein [uncultured Bacteroides sp.]|uniref:FecR family protein n=1 Tax=uncultured Bacteroides sp. TaxID=162156 RepID=UPI002AA64BBB|nr:FecR family protein [uncultured Bacteroides sp.]
MDRNRLYKFFSRKSTLEEEEEVLDWMERSDANQQEFLNERSIYNMTLMHVDDCSDGIGKYKKGFPIWGKEIIKVAAMLAVLFAMHFYYSSKEEEMSLAFNTVKVPSGQRVNLELPDGTKVCVNACSELTYPAVFSKEKRNVKLKGEAFFEVAHNANKPFVVETELCDVEALGTVFNVEAYPNSGEVSTALLSGKVRITDRYNADNRILLSPNQESEFTGQIFKVGNIRYPDHLRWREGLLCFQNMPVDKLIKELEKYYDVHFVISKSDILTHILSGKLRINEGIDHALRVLQKNVFFEYSRNDESDNTIYIK